MEDQVLASRSTSIACSVLPSPLVDCSSTTLQIKQIKYTTKGVTATGRSRGLLLLEGQGGYCHWKVKGVAATGRSRYIAQGRHSAGKVHRVHYTCNYMVVSAVQVLVDLWEPSLNIPEGDHAQTGSGTGLSMILECTMHSCQHHGIV